MAGILDAHILLRNEGLRGHLRVEVEESSGHIRHGRATEYCASDSRPLSDVGLGRCFAGLSIVPIMGRCLGLLVEPHLSHIRLGRSCRPATGR
jgi:hypothetical protein